MPNGSARGWRRQGGAGRDMPQGQGGALFANCPFIGAVRDAVGVAPPWWLDGLLPMPRVAAPAAAGVSGAWLGGRDGPARPESPRPGDPAPRGRERAALDERAARNERAARDGRCVCDERVVEPEETALIQAILDVCPFPALLVEPDGLVHHTSATLRSLLGIEHGETAGWTCRELLAAAGGPGLAVACEYAHAGEPHSTWAQAEADTPLAGAAGRPVGVVVTGVPLGAAAAGCPRVLITLQPQAEPERPGEGQDDLLLILSHELRRPLSSISASAELLAGGGLDEETQATLLHTVRNESNALATYLATILDAERVRSGASGVANEPVSLEPLVRSVLTEVRGRYPARVLSARSTPDLPVACGDRVRIAIVLRNLLENACKYVPEDRPVDVVLEYPGGDEVIVSIIDRGDGTAARGARAAVPSLLARRPRAGPGVARGVWRRTVHQPCPRRGSGRPHRRALHAGRGLDVLVQHPGDRWGG